jgi:ATP-dependent DNA helicase RecG
MNIFSSFNFYSQNKFLQKSLIELISGKRFAELLYHFPHRIEKNKLNPQFSEIFLKDKIIVQARVQYLFRSENSRQPVRVELQADGFDLLLIFFQYSKYIINKFHIGSTLNIAGEVHEVNHRQIIIRHPKYIEGEKYLQKIPVFEPIYPQTKGIKNYFFINNIREILGKNLQMAEWVDDKTLKEHNWSNWHSCMRSRHFPKEANGQELARRRLAYDEFLAIQIMTKIYQNRNQRVGKARVGDFSLRNAVRDLLPFSLTKSQERAIEEISTNIGSPKIMDRILQGDVGSGKTIVAFFAILQIIECGGQAVMMVPISLLAEQHFQNFQKYCQNLNIEIAIITGKTKKIEKSQIIKNLKGGKISIIIGTHALIYPEIEFNNLSLVVIDEQHRFGVQQRMAVTQKGKNVDVLSMSATPIPRSLMLSLFYGLEVSVIDEKPKNRPPITTAIISLEKTAEIYSAIDRAIAKKEKIFWICPLVDEVEENPKANVEKKYAEFCQRFGEDKVLAIHGKMKGDKKDDIMSQFKEEDFSILIATTVIEVGIDIPQATVIFIENAENFGLSQLHQLRGRVGRGTQKSYNILLCKKNLGEISRKRLGIIKNSNNGFEIAKKDLEIRGSGKVFGKDQSGFFANKIADFNLDWDLFELAKKNVEQLFAVNKEFYKEEKYQNLLKLFYDDL